MGESGSAATDPEVIVERGGPSATPHEMMEGSGSGATPHEVMEGSGSGAAPHEVSPLPRSRGQAQNDPAQTSQGRDLGIHPQNSFANRGRQRELLIPFLTPSFYFYFYSILS